MKISLTYPNGSDLITTGHLYMMKNFSSKWYLKAEERIDFSNWATLNFSIRNTIQTKFCLTNRQMDEIRKILKISHLTKKFNQCLFRKNNYFLDKNMVKRDFKGLILLPIYCNTITIANNKKRKRKFTCSWK